MTTRVAINGFGRIGRNFLRAWLEQNQTSQEAIEIVAINDIGNINALAHLLKFDTTHGVLNCEVSFSGEQLQVAHHSIAVFHEADPSQCPWEKFSVDVVIESTGHFRARNDAALHLSAGAKKVVIAAVAFDEVDATIVGDVNDADLKGHETIISAASCTTHAIAPVLSLIDRHFGVEAVLMTEMHAYTSDQNILDHVHRDLRRARSGAQNMIPTTSSSIGAVQKVLPQLKDKVVGYSMRVPINNVAAVDLSVALQKMPTLEKFNKAFEDFENKSLIAYSDLPLVSSDFNHRYESAIFDASQTQSIGNMMKFLIWYDNEWAYANRLLDLIRKLRK